MPITFEKIVRTHLKIGGDIIEHRERGGSITTLDMPKIILVEHEVLRSLNKRDPRFQAALTDSAAYFFRVVTHNDSFPPDRERVQICPRSYRHASVPENERTKDRVRILRSAKARG